MKELLFATHNQHKVDEVRKIMPLQYKVIGLRDIDWKEVIPEPFDTYRDNARAKTLFVFERTGLACFSDDSGLAVDTLNGGPGVYSARYAGPGATSADNIEKLLTELGDAPNRKAQFYSVISYISADGESALFEGIVEGRITHQPEGWGGFGYDPVFIPDGFNKTFGELPEGIKNKISHRAKAMQKFIAFLTHQK